MSRHLLALGVGAALGAAGFLAYCLAPRVPARPGGGRLASQGGALG